MPEDILREDECACPPSESAPGGGKGEPLPLVSVVIPVYNCGPYLRQCLDSVVAQTYAAWEIVCVDDGSTDDSASILREYAHSLEGRLRILSQENAGPARARNRGIDAARGDYLLFLDADDFLEPRCLELTVARALETDAQVVAFDIWFFNNRRQHRQHPPEGILYFAPFDADGAVFSWRKSPNDILLSFQSWPWNKLFSTAFVRAGGFRFQEEIVRSEDIMFVCSALVAAERIATVGERLVNYRVQRADSAMATKDRFAFDFLAAIIAFKKFLEREGLFELLRRGYENWALSSALYNLHSLASYDSFCEVYERLRESGFEEMGVAECPREAFFDGDMFDRMRDIGTVSPSRYLFDRAAELDFAREDALAVLDCVNGERDSARAGEKRAREEAAARIAQLEAEYEAELSRSRAETEALRAEFDAVMNAAEQKVGQAVCALPRAVQRAIIRRKEQ